MKNAAGGSDVSHVVNGDHATAAQAYLVAKGFTDWEVVLPTFKMLMLDYDSKVYDGTLPEVFYHTLGILEQALNNNKTYFVVSESKGGNTHCVVYLEADMPITERIAWQAAFGSDLKREALHLLSVALGDANPILLFMRKDRQTTGVDAQGNPVVQCSHYDVTTPEKLLAAGVPQLLLGDGNAG